MKKLIVLLALAFFSTASQAAIVQVTALPSSGGDFKHNNFHNASDGDATGGAILGWFELGNGGGTYDTVTGDILLNVDIYAANDQALTGPIVNTAVGIGTIDPTVWGNGGLLGSITWTFSLDNGVVETFFYDVDYGVSSDLGFTPNSLTSNSLTLWGSNGDLNPVTGRWDGACATAQCIRPSIGVDFAATFVPVPAAVWLFGSGLLAIAGISRRKTRC